MSQLAAHTAAMSTFYGVNRTQTTGAREEDHIGAQVVFRYSSMIVGLLSLFTIIALNVTNIIYMTESGGTMESIKTTQQSLSGSMKETTGILIEDLKPKTDLINSMVSFNIPSQLTMIYSTLKNEVLKQCTPSFLFNNTICPLAEHPIHSDYFEEVNLAALSSCAGSSRRLVINSSLSFIEFPSFIPGSTKPGSCVKLPSFSLSDTIFAYSHTIMGHGCSELDVGDHYFSVGRIVDHGTEQPIFETITEWFITDKLNRRSCTVAAGTYEAWMGCVIMTEPFLDDLDSTDTGKISISYLDVYGRRREWLYSKSEIQTDHNYASWYFSVGSGVVIGDTVRFLVWGSLVFSLNENAFCRATGCTQFTQAMCNSAQRPQAFRNHQMVNGILSFKINIEGKPVLSLKTISPGLIPLGSEGRLIHMKSVNKTYIYVRSTGWYAYPLIGVITFGNVLNIQWTWQTATSRPGNAPCGSTSRCPYPCVTGVYTDLFPLGINYEHTMTVYLDSETIRQNPTLAFSNNTNIVYRQTLLTRTQKADYTTTTCFMFKLRLWCLSIVELSPSTITNSEPVPFLYHVDLGCKDIGSNIVSPINLGSRSMHIGVFTPPRKECYFEQIGVEYYFIVSIPGSIQAYAIKDLQPDRVPHVGVYINDICPLILNTYTSLSATARMVTTLTVGNWQFRPVNRPGGVRVNLPKRKTNVTLSKDYSPEDPGNNYYNGIELLNIDLNDPIVTVVIEQCFRVTRITGPDILRETECRVITVINGGNKTRELLGKEDICMSHTSTKTVVPDDEQSDSNCRPCNFTNEFAAGIQHPCSDKTTSEPITHTMSTTPDKTTIQIKESTVSKTTISTPVQKPSTYKNQAQAIIRSTERHASAIPTKPSTHPTGTTTTTTNQNSHKTQTTGTQTTHITKTTDKHKEAQTTITTNGKNHSKHITNDTEHKQQEQGNHSTRHTDLEGPEHTRPTSEPNDRSTHQPTPSSNHSQPKSNNTRGPHTAGGNISHTTRNTTILETSNTGHQEATSTSIETTTKPNMHGTTLENDDAAAKNTKGDTTPNRTQLGTTHTSNCTETTAKEEPKTMNTTGRGASNLSTHHASLNTPDTPDTNNQLNKGTTQRNETSAQDETSKTNHTQTIPQVKTPDTIGQNSTNTGTGIEDGGKELHQSIRDQEPENSTLGRPPSVPDGSSLATNESRGNTADPKLNRLAVDTRTLIINPTARGDTPASQEITDENSSLMETILGDKIIQLTDIIRGDTKDSRCSEITSFCSNHTFNAKIENSNCSSMPDEPLCRAKESLTTQMEMQCPVGYLNSSFMSMLGNINAPYGSCENGEQLKPGYNYICNKEGVMRLATRQYVCGDATVIAETNITKPTLFNNTDRRLYNIEKYTGKYPMSYEEFVKWAGHYNKKPSKQYCSIGELCGYTFIIYYDPAVMIAFEPHVYHRKPRNKILSLIAAANICNSLYSILVGTTTTHDHLVVLPYNDKIVTLHSLDVYDFAKAKGSDSECTNEKNRRAYVYFSDKSYEDRLKSKNKAKNKVTAQDQTLKAESATVQSRQRRETTPSPNATFTFDVLKDLFSSALESLWYK
ncbi:cell attachment protein [Ninove microtus virus]|uniref:Cell attachment protein n=1 Tax=Ninove microtus virus TaxID=2940990 RepID=A0AAE9HWI7_9MONO|nr:cell attachment protein [Ninove microtus virus]